MAEVRKKSLHNPPRAKRKLSDKQIKIFGTKAQKAALKRRRSAKRGSSATHRRRPAKKNPGEIVTVALRPASTNNPSKRSTKTVAKKKRARRTASSKTTHRRRSRATNNPAPRKRHYRRTRAVAKRRAKRNPGGLVRNTGGFVMNAVYMIAGAVGSKAGTQAILGANNTGILGYAANLIAAFLIGKIVGKFTKNKQAENSAILGGVGQVVLRFLIDNTPYGSKLKDAGFGDYQFQSFVYPQRLADGNRSAGIAQPSQWRPQAAMMPQAVAAKTAGGLSGGRGLYGR